MQLTVAKFWDRLHDSWSLAYNFLHLNIVRVMDMMGFIPVNGCVMWQKWGRVVYLIRTPNQLTFTDSKGRLSWMGLMILLVSRSRVGVRHSAEWNVYSRRSSLQLTGKKATTPWGHHPMFKILQSYTTFSLHILIVICTILFLFFLALTKRW